MPSLRNARVRGLAIAALAIAVLAGACGGERPVLDRAGPTADWPEYGGDKGGLHWSPLTQITRENVGALEVAWTYHHGDVSDGQRRQDAHLLQRDADRGRRHALLLHRLEPRDRARPRDRRRALELRPAAKLTKLEGPVSARVSRRRVLEGGRSPAGGACRQRIFTGTIDSELIALDAATGEPCATSARKGASRCAKGSATCRPGSTTSPRRRS